MGRPDETQSVHVHIGEGAMSARLVYKPSTEAPALDAGVVLLLLGEKGVAITDSVRERVARAVAESAEKGSEPQERSWVLAEGTPPIHGGEGRLEFEPGLDPHAAEAVPTGGAEPSDHYSRSKVRAVLAGARIARVIEPAAGVDGVDVTGRSLSAREPRPVALLLDDSLERLADGTIVAKSAGTIDHRPPLLRVLGQLELPGFVDFSTGNVDFPGDVSVAKGVRDCFKLRAGGSVLVHGLVEAAEIDAALDVSLPGGMAGKQSGRLSAWRDARVFYLHNVTATVGRDLSVATELINSTVSVGGRLLAERATIAGGTVRAAGAVTVATLGSPSRVVTTVHLGSHESLTALRERGEALLPRLQTRAGQAQAQLDQLRAIKGRLSHSQAESLTELEFALAEAREKERRLMEKLDELARCEAAHARVSLTVRATLHSGVAVEVPGWRCEILTDLRGPIGLGMIDGRPALLSPGSTQPMEAGTAWRVIKAQSGGDRADRAQRETASVGAVGVAGEARVARAG